MILVYQFEEQFRSR